jgi:hypothetical protein
VVQYGARFAVVCLDCLRARIEVLDRNGSDPIRLRETRFAAVAIEQDAMLKQHRVAPSHSINRRLTVSEPRSLLLLSSLAYAVAKLDLEPRFTQMPNPRDPV